MTNYVLWLNHQYAYIYKFSKNTVEEKILKANSHEATIYFFRTIANSLEDASELIILGSDLAKDQFKHLCELNQYGNLANVISGVGHMASPPTKALMLNKSKDYFKHHPMYEVNV